MDCRCLRNRHAYQSLILWLPTIQLVLLATVLAQTARVNADDWPQFLGPNRDGVSKEKRIVDELSADGPPVVWRRNVGHGFSGPVVAGKKLILFHEVDQQDLVECIDVETGKAIWKEGTATEFQGGMNRDPGPRATPTIAGEHLYTFSPVGVLQCRALSTGKLVWQREVNKDYEVPDGYFGVSSSPLVEGKLLLVNVGSPKDAGLAAFDLATGKTVWTATKDEASYASPVAATIRGERLAFFFARTGLHCVEPATGKERFFLRWRARMNASVNAATPLAIGDQVFLTSSYQTGAILLRVKGDSYEKLWSGDDVMSSQYNTSVYSDGYLYGIDGRADFRDAKLRCVELATGKVAWSSDQIGCASIILVDGKLLLFDESGTLHLVRATPKGFEPLGKAALLKGVCRAHPALADGQFYARNQNELVRVNLKKLATSQN